MSFWKRTPTLDKGTFYAVEELSQSRSITPEGYLLVMGVPIARTGTQVYGAHELKGLPSNKDNQIIVNRAPEEVFKPESLASYEGKDITVDHPPDMVSPETWRNMTVGHMQNIRRGQGIEDDCVLADFLIKDADAIEYVNKKRPQVSCGYDCDYETHGPGSASQHNIIGNHVALVDRGRAGPRCAIKDSQPKEDFFMSGKTARTIATLLTAFANRDQAAMDKACDALDEDVSDKDKTASKDAMDARMKSMEDTCKRMNDWMDKQVAKEAKDTADAAEAERKRKESEDAAARDALLSAEAVPMLVNLGKTYTGDAASMPARLTDLFDSASVLVPATGIPTTDALKAGGDAIPKFIGNTLEAAYKTEEGKACIEPFLMGRELKRLTGDVALGVLMGAANAMRSRNSRKMNVPGISGVPSGEVGKPPKISDLNKQNSEFWAKQNAR